MTSLHEGNQLSPEELIPHIVAIIDSSDDAILSKDLNGIIRSWNKGAERIFGYTASEAVGQPVTLLIPPGRRDEEPKILARIRKGERIEHYETVRMRKDGSFVDISLVVSPIKDASGKIIGASKIARDISDRKNADRIQENFKAIVESSEDAIISKDLNGIVQSWNPGAERIFGYKPDEIIGKSITLLIPQGMENEEPEIISRIRQGKRVDHYETVRRRKDGKLVHISLSISPVKDSSGTVVGAAKIARDITSRKEAEEIIAKAKAEMTALNATLEQRVIERTASLNQAVAQMQEFSYSVSHDLRGPVRAMQGYATAILEDHRPSLNAEVAEYLQRICRASTRMDKLIRDVLIYSKVAQGQIRNETVLLEPLIKDIIENFPEMQLPDTQIQIRSPLLNVIGQESLLTQVITNLFGNAKKFMPAGVVSKIEIWTEQTDGRVRLWVKDNGIGIAPAYQARLFGMFERVHQDGNYEGMGIGLAIVRKAVERMEGKVGLESDGATGSAFWVELPPSIKSAS